MAAFSRGCQQRIHGKRSACLCSKNVLINIAETAQIPHTNWIIQSIGLVIKLSFIAHLFLNAAVNIVRGIFLTPKSGVARPKSDRKSLYEPTHPSPSLFFSVVVVQILSSVLPFHCFEQLIFNTNNLLFHFSGHNNDELIIIIPRNVGKKSQILRNPLKFAFLTIFERKTPYLGSDVMIFCSKLVVRNWVTPCAAVRLRFKRP